MSIDKEKIENGMTSSMKKVYDIFSNSMEAECLFCLEMLKEANKACSIKIEDKESVTYDCMSEIGKIATYWYCRLQLACKHVSKSFIEEHGLNNKYIGIDE